MAYSGLYHAGNATFQIEDAVQFLHDISEAYATSEDRIEVLNLTEAARPGTQRCGPHGCVAPAAPGD
jgi:hypothetical protein